MTTGRTSALRTTVTTFATAVDVALAELKLEASALSSTCCLGSGPVR